MRTIPEVVENIKNILNDAERTQDGECLVDIDDLVNEILTINSKNERKCEECAGCTNWLCDCANTRDIAIDEFAEALTNKLVLKYGNATPTEQYVALQVTDWIKEIAEQLKNNDLTEG